MVPVARAIVMMRMVKADLTPVVVLLERGVVRGFAKTLERRFVLGWGLRRRLVVVQRRVVTVREDLGGLIRDGAGAIDKDVGVPVGPSSYVDLVEVPEVPLKENSY